MKFWVSPLFLQVTAVLSRRAMPSTASSKGIKLSDSEFLRCKMCFLKSSTAVLAHAFGEFHRAWCSLCCLVFSGQGHPSSKPTFLMKPQSTMQKSRFHFVSNLGAPSTISPSLIRKSHLQFSIMYLRLLKHAEGDLNAQLCDSIP